MGPWYTTQMVLEWYAIKWISIDSKLTGEWYSSPFLSNTASGFEVSSFSVKKTTCRKWPKMESLQMIIKGDRLVYFSSGFQNITQLDKSFRLVYNMMDIGYQMATWPCGSLPFGTIAYLALFDSKLNGN